MKSTNAFLMSACLGLAATSAFAADDMMKKDGMAKPMTMTMEECKGHMAMAKKDASAKRDDAMMKKDTMCAEMMKKDDAMMKKDQPMKK
ncbi:MAG: hypothetical protein ABIQ06_01900 [Caldimonas sp.]